MPIYEVTQKEFRRIEEKGFSTSGLKERSDIQRLLRTQIDVIAQEIVEDLEAALSQFATIAADLKNKP